MMDEFFQENKLSLIEFDIPGVGCYSNPDMPLAHVKFRSSDNDRLIYPMKVRWSWATEPGVGFRRELVQELSKPVNIRLPMNRNAGFSYKIKTKENVVIARLLVAIDGIEDSITQMIYEANRFYVLYCFPAS
jgi:hypothetical protein